jgi:hypothetical protein
MPFSRYEIEPRAPLFGGWRLRLFEREYDAEEIAMGSGVFPAEDSEGETYNDAVAAGEDWLSRSDR